MHFRQLWTLDILSPIADEQRVFSSLRIPGHLDVQRRWALDVTRDESAELIRLASQTYAPSPSPLQTLLDQALVCGVFTIVTSSANSSLLGNQRAIAANEALFKGGSIPRCK